MYEGQIKVDAEITDAQLGESSNQHVQLLLSFVTPGCKAFGAITKGLFFTDAAIERTTKVLTDLGWNPEDNKWDIDGLIEKRTLVGTKVSLVCEEKEYQGKTSWQVVFVNKRGGMKTVYGSAERKAFAQQLRARTAPKAPTPIKDGDGIPF